MQGTMFSLPRELIHTTCRNTKNNVNRAKEPESVVVIVEGSSAEG